MRFSYKIQRIVNDQTNMFCGLLLEADYVGEHQVGIDDILSEMCGQTVPGKEADPLAKYRVRPDKCGVGSGGLVLAQGQVFGWKHGRRCKLKSLNFFGPEVYFGPDHVQEVAIKDRTLSASWSGKAFHISSRTDDEKADLRELMAAGARGELIICLAHQLNNPYGRGGLMFLIETRLEDDFLDGLKNGGC